MRRRERRSGARSLRRRFAVGAGLAALSALLVVSIFPDELLGPWLLRRARAAAAEAGYLLEVDSLRGLFARETRLSGVRLSALDPGSVLLSVQAEQLGLVVSAWGLLRGHDDALASVQAAGVVLELGLDGPPARDASDAPVTVPGRLPALELDDVGVHCRVLGERGVSLRDARVRLAAPAGRGGSQAFTVDAPSATLRELPAVTRSGTLSGRGTYSAGALAIERVLIDELPLLADGSLELPTTARPGLAWDGRLQLLDGTLLLQGGVTGHTLSSRVEARALSIAELAAVLGAGADGGDGSGGWTGKGPSGRLDVDGELRLPEVDGPFDGILRRGGAEMSLSARELRVPDAVVTGALVRPDGTRELGPRTLDVRVALRDGALVFSDGALETPGGRLLVRHGRVTLDAASLAEQIVELDGELDFPELEALGAVFGGPAWSGRAQGHVRVGGPLSELLGDVELLGEDVVLAGWPLGRVTLSAESDRRTLQVRALDIDGEALQLTGAGRLDLGTSTLSGVIVEGRLRADPRVPRPDARGELALALRAEGPLRDPALSLELSGADLTLFGVALQSLQLSAAHAGGTLVVETLDVSGADGTLSAAGSVVHADGVPSEFTLTRLDLAQDEAALALEAPVRAVLEAGMLRATSCVLTGSGGRLELDWDAPVPDPTAGPGSVRLLARGLVLPRLLTRWLPGAFRPERIDAELALGASEREPGARVLAGRVELGALELPLPGSDARLRGDAELVLDLAGTREQPRGRVDLRVAELMLDHGDGEPQGPGALVATLVLRDGVDVQSLLITGPGGMSLQGTGRIDGLAAGAPLDLDLAMAETDVAFLAPLIGDVRRLDGRIGAELRVRGELGAPVLTGECTVRGGELRLANAFPPLDEVSARVVLAQDGASIRELRGELGGSPFSATGTLLRTAAGPRLELQFAGQDLLLYRGEGVKLRADADLVIAGPPGALSVSGNLVLRDSRLARHLNLLHLAQGGGPARRRGLLLFSFTEPPLDTLRFDVRVRATEPFALDTNVVTGGLRPELQLTGTGRTPILTGTLFVEPSRVALPGGIVRVTSGRVLFAAADPFVPRLQVDARARQRGHDITISVTGPYDQPLVALSSVPPLPGDQLVLLLLTGQPPADESFGGAGSGADRFAVYVGQDLMARWLGNEAGTGDDGLLDRLELEVASDVTVSGEDSMQVSYRLTDRPREEGPITSLRAERDVYDKVNFGVQFLVRRP
jgi:hypothetical protein